MLPRFDAGDDVYCDRTGYVLPYLPEQLKQLPNLVCLQTAQNDKRSFSGNLLTFTVSRASIVLIGFDSRASPVPAWLGDPTNGFRRLAFNLPGTSSGFVYHVYGRLFSRGFVSLGPNLGVLNGAKRMYIVLAYPSGDVVQKSDRELGSKNDLDEVASKNTHDAKARMEVSDREVAAHQRDRLTAHFWDNSGEATRTMKANNNAL